MVQKELDWVLQNVVDQDTGLKEVIDCQVFLPTAPGPGNEGNWKFKQRELSDRSYPIIDQSSPPLLSAMVHQSSNGRFL